METKTRESLELNGINQTDLEDIYRTLQLLKYLKNAHSPHELVKFSPKEVSKHTGKSLTQRPVEVALVGKGFWCQVW